jgi:hypothetical protein
VVDHSDTDEDESEHSTFDNTRRQFVAGSAGVLGGLAVGSTFAGSALAQDDGTDDGDETPPEDEFEDDVAILNYALTLEYLEARFYQEGLDNIGEEGLCTCNALDQDSPLAERAFDELRTIQEHEEAHVEALVATIENLGGEPIEEPTFDFGYRVEYPIAFLMTAVQLEDTGVAAYAGAAPSIENTELIPTALGIHSVEARHAAFVRTLADLTSYPDVVDEPLSRSEVLEAATPFIVPEGEEPDEETPADEETPTDDGTLSEEATPTDDGELDEVGSDPTVNGTDTSTGTNTSSETGTDTTTGGSVTNDSGNSTSPS